jgi:UDP-N-acetylglucosamine 1-carboxyvinyltransferase
VAKLIGGRTDLLQSFCEKLDEAGVSITENPTGLKVARKNGRIRAVNVKTEVFPGFPTDLQAQMMALMCTASGESHLEETIFENRFMHAPELMRMGAQIDVHGGVATVKGVERLRGAPVMATDLRASVSLILAGLAAEGETRVARVYHLDRGYEHVEEKLSAVGASIERMKGERSPAAAKGTRHRGSLGPLGLGARCDLPRLGNALAAERAPLRPPPQALPLGRLRRRRQTRPPG